MIKPNELRIGDWVSHPNNCHTFQVLSIEGKAIGFSDYLYYSVDELQPIPLTPELLIKAGFEDWGTKETGEYEKERQFVLYNVIEGTSSFIMALVDSWYGNIPFQEWVARVDHDSIYTKELKYYHQLQNLYHAITGNEII